MSRSRHPARTRCGGGALHTVQRVAAARTGQRAEQGRPSLQGIYAILARLPAACGRNNATEQSQRNAAAAAHHRIVGYCRSGAGAGSAMACGLAGELASRRDRRSPAAAGVLPVGLAHYPQWRDFPDRPGTTRLSPYLHFGEISARQAVWTLQDYSQRAEGPGLQQATEALNPQLGRRQLWQTRWMHNRVRMITASFLVNICRIHWQHGARWFWDTLTDANLANNSLKWHWITGCGAGAAPVHR